MRAHSMLVARRAFRAAPHATACHTRFISVTPTPNDLQNNDKPGRNVASWEERFGGAKAGLPDFIEHWSPALFKKVGVGMVAGDAALLAYRVQEWNHLGGSSWDFVGNLGLPLGLALPIGFYWYIGLKDIANETHAIRRNFPFLGNMRYLLESIRPEIRQYFVESDNEGAPYNRAHRSIAYARAKAMSDTLPLGTQRNVYDTGYEWANHSMFPNHVHPEEARITIGLPGVCKHPYSASVLNISAMSYGALSAAAIQALNAGAKRGNFYHNTGEGGISRFHDRDMKEGSDDHTGSDLVWNVGTGYFGCRTPDGKFCPDRFKQTASRPNVKMIEIKLSQGAKPGHGGILPGGKITDLIREARGLPAGYSEDVLSPPLHSAFEGPRGLVKFVAQLRELSGGKPVGFKLCVGQPEEFAAVVGAMVEFGVAPDFITVDGGEGGTGAAPPEFSNSVGMPLVEGLGVVTSLLSGAGLRNVETREGVKIICSGKVLSGFSLARNLAIGADVCNAARSMMLALGCIQALKCNTNTCPTGIATQRDDLQRGLVIPDKAGRVKQFQEKTVEAMCEIVGAMGLTHPHELQPHHIMQRVSHRNALSYRELAALRTGTFCTAAGHGQILTGKNGKDFTGGDERVWQWWEAGQEALQTTPATFARGPLR